MKHAGVRAATLWLVVLGMGCTRFEHRVLATGMDNPFEVLYGPDGFLWVTERTGKRVTRVSVEDGAKVTVATIDEVMVTPMTQDGLLGMALHPDLLRAKGTDHVFVAYTYDADPDPVAQRRRLKIVRFTYDPASGTLGEQVELLSNLPGSNDHNSGKLRFGPDGRLYYSLGDQGNNQFMNKCNPIRAQFLPTAAQVETGDWSHYEGKILRLELDGRIPADNPVLDGVRSHVYSYGHRNSQGLAFSPQGRLYQAEHGPKTDDEVNLIEAGANYGWPNVAGFRDDRAYVFGNWSASTNPPCEELEFSDFVIPPSVPVQTESAFDRSFRPPMATFFTVQNGFNFMDPNCAENMLFFICWPTIAPSSLEVYAGFEHHGVPEFGDSLLVTSLKQGVVFRIPLGHDGRARPKETEKIFETENRYRDTAVDPTGRIFYISTDNAGPMLGDDGRPHTKLANPGSILEFRARSAIPGHR
jgi:PQQ-dependent dehydrogenase (s-GDH family)